jgi:tetratricopeptide (TPR) repeat protein
MGWLGRLICVALVGLVVPAIGAEPPSVQAAKEKAGDMMRQAGDAMEAASTQPAADKAFAASPGFIGPPAPAGNDAPLDPATTQPVTDTTPNIPDGRPIVQFTVRLPEGYNDVDQTHSGDLLIRELQRQAVLMSAREELGLRTRDMLLDEPFLTPGRGGINTVLIFTRVHKDRTGETAALTLGTCHTPKYTDPSDVADLALDDKQVTRRYTYNQPMAQTVVPTYTTLVTGLEARSRDAFPAALQSAAVMCGTQADPTRWVDDTGPDATADDMAQCPDVFHQYLVVREMHRQMRASGASYRRVDMLVRAYSDLGILTGSQWSWALDAFQARSLLYAERLVVHENSSPRSLYTRAYARATTGLQAAALADLDAADKAGGKPPAWAGMIRDLCKWDLEGLNDCSSVGPWQYRGIASVLLGVVANDGYAGATSDAVAAKVIGEVPGALFMPENNGYLQYAACATSALPLVLRATIRESQLPPAIKNAAAEIPGSALMSNEPDGYYIVGNLRDQLAKAGVTDAVEPSLGVLSGLVEQQSFAAIVRRACNDCSTFTGNAGIANAGIANDYDGLQAYAAKADPILKKHPWGPMLAHLRSNNTSMPDKDCDRILSHPKPRDNGWWIDVVNNHVVLSEREQKKLDDNWVSPGHRLAAQTVFQYGNTTDGRGPVGTNEPLWHALRGNSPYSASVAGLWILSVPRNQWLTDKPLYTRTLDEIADRFYNRPDVVDSAVDICELRGDFDRSFSLMFKLSMIAPSSHIYERMARTARHQGRREQAIACIDAGLKIAPTENWSGSNGGALAVLKARIEADEGHYDDALATIARIEAGTYANNDNSYLSLQARCYEAMGNLDDAESSLRNMGNTNLPQLYQAYFFARRTGRQDAESLHKAAQAQVADQIEPKVMMLLADGNDDKALDAMKDQNIGWWLQLERMILGAELNKPSQVSGAVEQIMPYNLPLGQALNQVVNSKELRVALKQFDEFEAIQLNTEDLVRYDSALARYLIAAGHHEEGVRYLTRALRRPDHEQDGYFLAWIAAEKLGLDPASLAASAK